MEPAFSWLAGGFSFSAESEGAILSFPHTSQERI